MSYLSSPDAVLLGRKRHRDKICGLEVALHGRGRKDDAAASEGSVFESEKGAI